MIYREEGFDGGSADLLMRVLLARSEDEAVEHLLQTGQCSEEGARWYLSGLWGSEDFPRIQELWEAYELSGRGQSLSAIVCSAKSESEAIGLVVASGVCSQEEAKRWCPQVWWESERGRGLEPVRQVWWESTIEGVRINGTDRKVDLCAIAFFLWRHGWSEGPIFAALNSLNERRYVPAFSKQEVRWHAGFCNGEFKMRHDNRAYIEYLFHERLRKEWNCNPGGWWSAARSIGLTFEEFERTAPSILLIVLEAKAEALQSLYSSIGIFEDQAGYWARYVTRWDHQRIGRPRNLEVDGPTLRGIRRKGGVTQENLAEICGVSLDTIQRAENGTASEQSVRFIAEGLARLLKRSVKPSEFSGKPQ